MNVEIKRLADLADIFTGLAGFADQGTYTYNVVQPNSFLETGEMESVEQQRRSDEVAGKYLLIPGDILVKRLNPSFVHVVETGAVGMVASQNLLIVRPKESIDPYYLGYLLEQKEIIGQIEHVTGSAAAIKAISVKKLADTMIPVASASDQGYIGKIWCLSRRRKRLLYEYIAENDKLMARMASTIISDKGKKV